MIQLVEASRCTCLELDHTVDWHSIASRATDERKHHCSLLNKQPDLSVPLQAAFTLLLAGPASLFILVDPTGFTWMGDCYSTVVDVTVAGTYTVSIQRGGLDVQGSPSVLTIVPGATDPAATIVQLPPASAVAGVPSTITVQACPSFPPVALQSFLSDCQKCVA